MGACCEVVSGKKPLAMLVEYDYPGKAYGVNEYWLAMFRPDEMQDLMHWETLCDAFRISRTILFLQRRLVKRMLVQTSGYEEWDLKQAR